MANNNRTPQTKKGWVMVSEAARRVNRSRATLIERLEKLGIEPLYDKGRTWISDEQFDIVAKIYNRPPTQAERVTIALEELSDTNKEIDAKLKSCEKCGKKMDKVIALLEELLRDR